MTKQPIEKQLRILAANNYNLPASRKPILQLQHTAEILIIGPAPGNKAHKSGTSWNDRSGDRLRSWMDITREDFYNKDKIALISMNFWYPGVNKYGNDNPPSLVDAERWHRPLLKLLPNIKLVILAGHQPQLYYLKHKAKATLTATVKTWQDYLPAVMVLPHPSWHNNKWIKDNLWFEIELLPEFRKYVKRILKN